MSPAHWWPVSIVIVGLIAVGMEALDEDEFDPASLPPPAAGIAPVITTPRHTCEGVIYSVSKDGIKYVRESGGGVLLAAELDNKIGFFELGEYSSLRYLDRKEMDPETTKRLEYALTSCSAEYLPSGVNFSYRHSDLTGIQTGVAGYRPG